MEATRPGGGTAGIGGRDFDLTGDEGAICHSGREFFDEQRFLACWGGNRSII
jgi:hypothetical protein